MPKKIDPKKVVWISLGCLRFPPTLKEIIKKRLPKSKIIYEEFIKGRDGKLRYLMPVRIKMYNHLISHFEKYVKRDKIYFCMESPEVWEAALSEKQMTTAKLTARLDNLAVDTLL